MASSRSGWALVLAAMLGQIGLPGGGFGYALGAIALLRPPRTTPCRCRRCRRAATASRDFIPVARIADMLLNPGATFATTARRVTYPDIRLVYWAGGNPFHHHQDLNRLRRAFAQRRYVGGARTRLDRDGAARRYRPARTMTLEREDIGGSSQRSPAGRRCTGSPSPIGEARDDYAIFADLAERLGAREAFTEGPHVAPMAGASVRADARALAERGPAGARASTNSGRAAA